VSRWKKLGLEQRLGTLADYRVIPVPEGKARQSKGADLAIRPILTAMNFAQ